MSDPKILKAALCCLGEERRNLHHPIITPDRTLVATDGARILVCPGFISISESGRYAYAPLLPLPLTLHMGPTSSTPFTPSTATSIYFDFSKLEPNTEVQPLPYRLYFAQRRSIDGVIYASYGEQFPDWKQVVSAFDDAARDQSCLHDFNPALITDVQKALKAKFVHLQTYEGNRYIATFPMHSAKPSASTASTLKLYFLGYTR